jgi:hypothetical protein
MVSSMPALADSRNKFEDLSGVDIAAYTNPYDALIEACQNDPVHGLFYLTTHALSSLLPNEAIILDKLHSEASPLSLNLQF